MNRVVPVSGDDAAKPARADDSMEPRDELVTHLGALRAFAISLCRNPTLADDLVQDTVVRAWRSLASFQRGTNMRAWLFTICATPITPFIGSRSVRCLTRTGSSPPPSRSSRSTTVASP